MSDKPTIDDMLTPTPTPPPAMIDVHKRADAMECIVLGCASPRPEDSCLCDEHRRPGVRLTLPPTPEPARGSPDADVARAEAALQQHKTAHEEPFGRDGCSDPDHCATICGLMIDVLEARLTAVTRDRDAARGDCDESEGKEQDWQELWDEMLAEAGIEPDDHGVTAVQVREAIEARVKTQAEESPKETP